jgi:hypothetical protein
MDGMDTLTELMQIETRLATGRGSDYREVLSDDARVIVPGAVLDRDACVAAMDASPGWQSFSLDEPRLIEAEGTAVVVYRFSGTRADTSYTATLASSYRMPERRLFLHQHTPDN